MLFKNNNNLSANIIILFPDFTNLQKMQKGLNKIILLVLLGYADVECSLVHDWVGGMGKELKNTCFPKKKEEK